MSRVDLNVRAGDWVEVKGRAQIFETLDANGTLDGLPFMPEMLAFCGRRFQVLRLAEKTCFEFAPNRYGVQEFRNNDVVILSELRCSGSDHDGCARACFLFWKTSWIQKVDPKQIPTGSHGLSGPKQRLDILRTKTDAHRYVCQATELIRATRPIPRLRKVLKCFSAVRSGSRSAFEMAGLMWQPIWRKATSWFPRRVVAGPLKKTPVGDLKLQPGELVMIKSVPEIEKTLNSQGRNRGMICDAGMCRFSGGTYKVRSRLDRMISEPTGEMLQVESTVILDGLYCLCWNTLGGCPRQDFLYWREVWLDRVGSERPH